MKKNYFEKQIIKSAYNRIFSYIFLAAIVGLICYFGVLMQNVEFLYKPVITVRSSDDIKAGYTIKIRAIPLFYSGFDKTESNDNASYKTVGTYGIVNLKDGSHLLVLLNNKDSDLIEQDVMITGIVSSLEGFEKDMVENILKNVKAEDDTYDIEDGRQRFLQHKVSHGSNYIVRLIIAYALIIVILWFIYKVIVNILVVTNYKNDKLYKKLSLNSNIESLEQKINTEVETENCIFLDKRSIITDTAVAIFIAGSCIIKKHDELLWIYKSITSHSTNGIPTGKTFAIRFVFSDKQLCEVNVKNENAADELIEKISKRYPYIITGFSEDLQNDFYNNIDKYKNLVNEKR